jgi:hypothetical protein
MAAISRSRRPLAAPVAALGLLPALAFLACAAAPPALAATAAGVTIQTSYENTPISVNMSDAVGYELTNTTGHAETVSFTDALPAGVTVDNPASVTDTNGTGTCVLASSTANPGATSVILSVQVPSVSSSGAVCTISVGIVPGTPSRNDVPLVDSYSSISATPATTVSSTTGGLTVLSEPTLTVTAPVDGQVFALAQIFDASFTCAASDPLDSVDSFFGTDDRGNQIASGGPIDTVDPGSHTLEIECYSAAGGGYVTQTVNYSVGSYSLTSLRTTTTGRISFRSLLPAGKLVAKVLDGSEVIGKTTATVAAAEVVKATVKPTTAGLKVLRATKGKSVKLKLQASFTPVAIGTGAAEITPTSAIVVTRSNIRLVLATIRKSR